MNKSALSCLFLILILSLILIDVQSQRGGGRSRSRGGSGGFGKSRKKAQPLTKFQIFTGIIISCIFYIICFVIDYFQQKNRNSKIKQIMQQFQEKNKSTCCLLNQNQRKKYLDSFRNKSWKIKFQSNNGQNNGQFSFHFGCIQKINNDAYNLFAKGYEKTLGKSDLEGILLFKGNKLSLCFSKTYAQKKKAGQNGRWDILIYQGVHKGQQFIGKWYYQGFQDNGKYSGKMKMFHI